MSLQIIKNNVLIYSYAKKTVRHLKTSDSDIRNVAKKDHTGGRSNKKGSLYFVLTISFLQLILFSSFSYNIFRFFQYHHSKFLFPGTYVSGYWLFVAKRSIAI